MKLFFTLRETLVNHYRTEENITAYIWRWYTSYPHNPLGYFPDSYRRRIPEDNWLPYNLRRLL